MSKELNRIRERIQLYKERWNKAKGYVDALDRSPWATVIRRKYAYVFAGNEKRGPRGEGVEIEVRNKVYGGAGKVTVRPKGVSVYLVVLEPYALSVERRTGIRSKAIAHALAHSRSKFTVKKSVL